MTDDRHDIGQDTIGNATAIIERFGGIRPMATKMGVPVTTVQGWKQRNAIPASRRDDIIRAATANGLNLGDLLLDITSGKNSEEPDDFRQRPQTRVSRGEYDTAMPKTDITKPLFYGGMIMLAGAIIGGVFALAPHVKNIGQDDQRVAELQAEIDRLKQEQEENSFLPDGMQKSLAELQTKVHDMSEQAKTYSTALEDLKTGTVQQRIAKLEGHVNHMLPQAQALGLSGMLNKIQGMQQTPEGSDALSSVVNLMLGQLGAVETEGQRGDKNLEAALGKLRETDPAVAQTLEGVAPEDMKAAAMLLGMAQLRQSLMRDKDSFDTDLDLLKQTAAKDDPALRDAIDRLAPQAKAGVLTPDGLSKEFRGLAGDIVAASLTGEDVSLEDKVKARLNNVMIVEKAGRQVSGTPTQQTIAEAQKMLDAGNVEGAVALLQGLEGPAADKAQPFIDQAQATIAAKQLQQLLGHNIIGQLKNTRSLGGGSSVAVNPTGLNGLIGQVQGMIPGMGMHNDSGSGYSIYVPPPQVPVPAQKGGH